MPYQRNKATKQVEDQSSTLNPKNSPIPKTTGKIKDDVIFAKDKSPDDMEIID